MNNDHLTQDSKIKKILSDYPIEAYIEQIDKYPEVSHSKYVCQEIKNRCEQISSNYGMEALGQYHALVMLELIDRSTKKLKKSLLPEEIKELYEIDFSRIKQYINAKEHPPDYFLYTNNKFRKDFGIVSLRIIPTGARKINMDTLSKRFLINGNFFQFVRGLLFVLVKLRGFQPFYQMHTHSHDPHAMAKFNEEGIISSYQLIAKLLEKEPEIRGVFGNSWFNDPELEHISPRLSYLRKIATNNGGQVFYMGVRPESIKDALLKSKTRRKLFAEGKYQPANYLLIWPRKELLEWAKKQ